MEKIKKQIAEMDNKYIRRVITVVLGSAIIFGLLGLLLPPCGVISNSVLIMVSQLLIFAGTCIVSIKGINTNIDVKKGVFQIDADKNGENDIKDYK